MDKNIAFLLLLVLLFGVSEATDNKSPHHSCPACITCSPRPCTLEYRPVCGKKYLDQNLVEQKIFGNQCAMDNENLCGGGYVPCCWFEGIEGPIINPN